MNIRHSILFLIVLQISLGVSLFAQALPLGSWRVHLPYQFCRHVSGNDNEVFAATEDGLFKLNKADNSIQRITKIEGLSDLIIGSIQYNPYNGVLMVGYKNGNIDIIRGNQITNLPDIKRSQIVANKTINNIYFIGPKAYVSTGFGIVVVDTDRNEISDTYLIGPNGTYLEVFDVTSDPLNLYVATFNGVYTASLSDPFLSNFASWTRYSGLPPGIYNTVGVYNNILIANFSNDMMGNGIFQDVLYMYDLSAATGWTTFPGWSTGHTAKDIEVQNNILYIADIYAVVNFTPALTEISQYYTIGNSIPVVPVDVFVDNSGTIWVAHLEKGLVKMVLPYYGLVYYPNGPASTDVSWIDVENGILTLAPGGKDDAWNNIYNRAGVSNYARAEWNIWNSTTCTGIDSIYDINYCKIDPSDSTHVWLGSWGMGLVEIRNGQIANQYSNYNSILERKVEYQWCGVGGLDYDDKGNLWMVNSHTTRCLKVLQADGTWAQFEFQGLITGGTTVGDLMVTESGQKWMIVPRGGGILVFDDNGTIATTGDDRKKKLGFTAGTGSLPGTEVYCMAEDRDGEIWVGTDEGVAVFYCSENIFSPSGCEAQQILIQQGEYTQILLENQVVTSIAVDGANRKWIGTESGGVFLMSEDGTDEILHFTKDNSPLLDDNINSIAIDQKTGEVFFGTAKGIVSYIGDAVEGGQTFGDVYAYPNPVKPGYSGPIAIKGLVQDADVKITDIAGNFVFGTTALGGQAIWDGRNFAGERVASGVYLVFITNEDGTQKKVTKILFMH